MTLLRRAVVTWAIEVVALLLLARVLPGLELRQWETAIPAVLAIGLLNATIRPLVLVVATNLGRIPFGIFAFFLVALLLNAAMVLLAGEFVPGFHVDGVLTAFLAALGLTALNTLFTSLLSLDDEDSYYRNVVRRLTRRHAPHDGLDRPGTVVIQIDGLAEPILRRELQAGRLPTLARWLASGSHRLVQWECGIPSMTSGSQAGILHGCNTDIPAFRWYDKDAGRMFVSNHPADACRLEQRLSHGQGLLQEQGSSLSNLLAGGSSDCVLTMSALFDPDGRLALTPRGFTSFFASPSNLNRALLGMLADVVREYWEAWQQRRRNVQPRGHRGGVYPLLRAVSTVLMRDITLWLIVDEMYNGRRVIYCTFLGYDEVAHHAGPATDDALRWVRDLDRHLARLERAVPPAPRPYQLVVLSDHGQSFGATFRQRYGLTLYELVRQLVRGDRSVHEAAAADEGWGRLSAVLTELVRVEGVMGAGARRLLSRQDGQVDVNPESLTREAPGADVVVCPSGNLALIYFARHPGRLSLEFLVAEYPGLVEGLVQHPGVGFLLVYSEARGPLAMGRAGARRLDSGEVAYGEDPLASFSPHTAEHLRRLSSYSNCPDIVVNSCYDPVADQVAAFEELIGCHGGAGGMQTQPFLLYPAAWTAAPPTIVGAEAVHTFLNEHVG